MKRHPISKGPSEIDIWLSMREGRFVSFSGTRPGGKIGSYSYFMVVIKSIEAIWNQTMICNSQFDSAEIKESGVEVRKWKLRGYYEVSWTGGLSECLIIYNPKTQKGCIFYENPYQKENLMLKTPNHYNAWDEWGRDFLEPLINFVQTHHLGQVNYQLRPSQVRYEEKIIGAIYDTSGNKVFNFKINSANGMDLEAACDLSKMDHRFPVYRREYGEQKWWGVQGTKVLLAYFCNIAKANKIDSHSFKMLWESMLAMQG